MDTPLTKKQSDLEKRLKLLRQQLVGGSEFRVQSVEKVLDKNTTHYTSDITYLRYDLGKILALSTLAIGIQLILFILTKNHVLNLNFF